MAPIRDCQIQDGYEAVGVNRPSPKVKIVDGGSDMWLSDEYI
jgi:hypothetical protein